MSALPMTHPSPPPPHAAVLCGVLLLASAGAAAIWTLVSLAVDRQLGWMAIVAAVDAAIVLRFMRMPRGIARMLLAAAGTLLAIVLANWWIAGGQMGALVGFPPWDAIPRLGAAHAWTLFGLANTPLDLAAYAVAVVAALLVARW